MSPELPEKAANALVAPMQEALGKTSVGQEAAPAQAAPENTITGAGIMETRVGDGSTVRELIDQHRADEPNFPQVREEYKTAIRTARGMVEAPDTAATAGSNTEGGSTAPATVASPDIGAVSTPAAEGMPAAPVSPTGAEAGVPQGPPAPMQP